MTDDVEQSDPTGIDQMGPVDYLVVEFPGSKMTGEGLPILLDLVDRASSASSTSCSSRRGSTGRSKESRSPTSTVR